jgi:hypothetical protein
MSDIKSTLTLIRLYDVERDNFLFLRNENISSVYTFGPVLVGQPDKISAGPTDNITNAFRDSPRVFTREISQKFLR